MCDDITSACLTVIGALVVGGSAGLATFAACCAAFKASRVLREMIGDRG